MKLPTLAEIRAEKARRSLAEFIRQGWHVLEPAVPLEWNWHIDAIADHIQAVLEDWQLRQQNPDHVQRIQNLLINVPPGTMKSRIVCVYAPAWMWTRCPEWRAIFLSANPRVALRDSVYCRDVLESQWFRETFKPEWSLAEDQNAKGLFKNTVGGFRQALGFRSKITGDRADALFVDDPHDAEEVKSEVQRTAVLERWDSAIGNRVNDLRTSVRIGVMQRLHGQDWSAHVLGKGGWEHLCLPMEFEPERFDSDKDRIPRVTAIGWSDPRKEKGELLFPQRFTPEVVASEKTRLGPTGYAGQHQQRPADPEGGFFKVAKLEIIPAAPAGLRWVRAWDLAATKGAGDYTAGVKMGTDGEGRFYIANVKRGQWATDDRNATIKQTAALDGRMVRILGPQDPGAAGKEAAQAFTRLLAGYVVETHPVSGAKEVRADPFSAQVGAGNVFLVEGDWNEAFIEELRLFPHSGEHDDQVDAASDAFNELAGGRRARAAAAPAKPQPAGMRTH